MAMSSITINCVNIHDWSFERLAVELLILDNVGLFNCTLAGRAAEMRLHKCRLQKTGVLLDFTPTNHGIHNQFFARGTSLVDVQLPKLYWLDARYSTLERVTATSSWVQLNQCSLTGVDITILGQEGNLDIWGPSLLRQCRLRGHSYGSVTFDDVTLVETSCSLGSLSLLGCLLLERSTLCLHYFDSYMSVVDAQNSTLVDLSGSLGQWSGETELETIAGSGCRIVKKDEIQEHISKDLWDWLQDLPPEPARRNWWGYDDWDVWRAAHEDV